jgi:hypothetical protein
MAVHLDARSPKKNEVVRLQDSWEGASYPIESKEEDNDDWQQKETME